MRNSGFRRTFFNSVQIIGLGILIFFCLINKTPDIGADAGSYIRFDVTRPPVYPIFLWLFHGLGQYQFFVVIWVQGFLSFLALLYARNWLHKHLDISSGLIFFILCLTILQIFFHYDMLRLIYSEALAFPLFIITFFSLVNTVNDFSKKNVICLALTTSLLILTRAQFYYFYFLFTLLIVFHIWKKSPVKKTLVNSLIILLSILLTMGFNRSYHYFMHGHFSEIPAAGKQLVIQPLFLTDSKAIRYLNDPTEKSIFSNIMQIIEEHQLSKKNAPATMLPPLALPLANQYYNTTYVPITHAIDSAIKGFSPYQADKILIHITKQLAWHEPKTNLIFYFWKIISFYGDTSFFLFFQGILLAIGWRMLFSRNHALSTNEIFIFVTLLTILLNTAFIAIPEVVGSRYSYYCYFLIYCLGGLFAQTYLNPYGTIMRFKPKVSAI